MALSILTDNTKASLEQERLRLTSERDAIIQAAVEQATVEIDQMLNNLNQLLGHSSSTAIESQPAKTPKSSNQVKKAAQPATKKGAAKTAAIEEKPPAPTAKTASKAKTQIKTASKSSKSATPAQPIPVKQEFKSLTPTEAVKQIMQKANQPMTTDDVIQSLYKSVKEEDSTTARKTVALILGRGTHQGVYEKVEENPSRYQLKA
jgi:hypothetical protein